MARKPRRRSSNFVVLKVQAALALGTLADDAVITATLLDLNDDLKVIGADLTWSIRDLAAGEGPILVGLSTNAYTVAQIVEAIDASPNNRSDEIALERTRRKVRNVGSFAGALPNGETLNEGRPMRTRKLYWKLSTDRNIVFWAQNKSGVANLATGAFVEVSGKVYAQWT